MARMFTPLADQILVVRREPMRMSEGGIHLPERDQEKQLEGEVLAVGPGRFEMIPSGPSAGGYVRRPLDVLPGSVVLFKKYAGTDVKLDGQECLVLEPHEILGILLPVD